MESSTVAPLLAEHVLAVERSIASGAFAAQSLGPELLLDLHSRIAGDLVPDWAGRWRTIEEVSMKRVAPSGGVVSPAKTEQLPPSQKPWKEPPAGEFSASESAAGPRR